MKRFAILAACAAVLSFVLGACTTAPTITFQQQVTIVCAAAKTAVQIATDDGVFTGGAEATLTDVVSPAVSNVCAAKATATPVNLQTLVSDGLPAVKSAVNASSLSQQTKNGVNAAIDVATLAVNTAIALAPTATATTATTGITDAASAAPAAK